jgi:hypothetical protein
VARKIEVQLLDDIDGGQADETLRFSLDGVGYEIDVSVKHANELRGSLEKYIDAARRIGRGAVTGARVRAGNASTPTRVDRAQNQAIRDWAKRKGIQLNDRGRIPTTIVTQYQAEAGR